jgi:4'-phosphopantetheinyl transferase
MFSRSVDVLVGDLTTVEIDEDLLSVAELGRALRIARTPLLREYLAVHCWLRRRLSEYLNRPADQIRFTTDESGKPEIAAPDTDLSFNLSYSGGIVVLAAGFRMAVGVDVETLEGARINPEMIHRVLSRPEESSVHGAPDPVKEFHKLWVRKEALAKATGLGVDGDVASINVLGLSPVTRDGFDLADMDLGEGFVAAVAVPTGCSIELTALAGVAASQAAPG